jgi:hypothetical protein
MILLICKDKTTSLVKIKTHEGENKMSYKMYISYNGIQKIIYGMSNQDVENYVEKNYPDAVEITENEINGIPQGEGTDEWNESFGESEGDDN